MHIYLDSANTQKTTNYLSDYNLQGATSNPTILYKDACLLEDFLHAIPRNFTCFAQVIASDYNGILSDAQDILNIREDVVIKIPAHRDGLRAITTLHKNGVKTLATAIYTLDQAILAAHCGAEYVAPYVNRMCDLGVDGVQTTIAIQQALTQSGYACEVVGASFKNLQQITLLMQHGIDAITIPLDLFDKMLSNESTLQATHKFKEDYYALTKMDGTI